MNRKVSLESLSYFLDACDDDDWIKHHRLRALTLLEFIEKNNLIAKDSKLNSSTFNDDFELFESDLTREGVEWYNIAIDKWDDSHDRGQSPDNTKILEKYLKKIRTK
jgi:hypothetical protein